MRIVCPFSCLDEYVRAGGKVGTYLSCRPVSDKEREEKKERKNEWQEFSASRKKGIEGYKGPARENKKRGSVVTSIKSEKGSTGHPRKILHEHLARFLWAWKHSKSCVALPPCRHFTLFVGVCCVKCSQLMNWFFESKERILIFVSSVQIEINT